MTEEKVDQEFKLKEMDEKRIYLIEEIKKNELHLHLLILGSKATECASISAFASLFGIPVVIASSAATTNICAIVARIKKSKSVLDSNISHNEFVVVNNVLKEYDDMKEEVKNSNDK